MKRIAHVLMVVGVLVAVIAFNLDVTVGDTGIVNINSMAQRQNFLIIGCVGFLAGIVLLVGVQQQDGRRADQEGQKQEENLNTKNIETIARFYPAIKIGSNFFYKYVFRRLKPIDFFGRTFGAIYSAIVGAFIVHEVIDSLSYIDIFYREINMFYWMHTEIFYFPAMLLIFFTVMKNGILFLIKIFYLEMATCIVWWLILMLFFDAKWSAILFFSSEIFYCIVGVLLANKLKVKVTPSIQ